MQEFSKGRHETPTGKKMINFWVYYIYHCLLASTNSCSDPPCVARCETPSIIPR
jgi:Fe-S-cluster-containing dehydrogenase component